VDRRPSVWFAGAWVLLVVVIAFAFWRQDRAIDQLEEDIHTATIADAVVTERLQDFDQLCRLLVRAEPDSREAIVDAFAKGGVDCFPSG